MAILFITHKFPPSIGGMQKQSYELVNGVSRNQKVYLLNQGINESKLWFFISLRSRVLKMLKQNPDIRVIHCNDAVMAAFVSFISFDRSIKLSCTFHGLDVVFPNKFYQKFILSRMHGFHKIFCVSEATRNESLKRGFTSDQVITIHNGVDSSMNQLDVDNSFKEYMLNKYGVDLEKHKLIISIGRAVKRKGFSWFVKNIVPRIRGDFRYLIIGPKLDRKDVFYNILKLIPRSISRQIKLLTGFPDDSVEISKLQQNNIRVVQTGSIAYDEMLKIISCTDLMVMPNINVHGDMEGFGLVALECNMMSCPVVASGIEGITSAIRTGSNGLLLEPENIDQWVTTINALLMDEDRLYSMAVSGKNYVNENYNWELMTNSYSLEFKELFSDPLEQQLSFSL